MPFQKNCASKKLHGEWDIIEPNPLVSKVKASVRDKLFELCELDPTRKFHRGVLRFCTACITKVLDLYPDIASPQQQLDDEMPPAAQTPLKRKLTDKFDDASEESTGKFNVEKLSSSERAQLAYELGKFEHETCKTYVRLTEENNLDTLLSADVNSEVDEKCKTPFAFLCGLAGLHQSSYQISVGGNIQYKLHKALESTVNLSALNVTLPVHFREAVLLYALTGSKVALQILGSGGAHASYKVVKSWLASLGSTITLCQMGILL